jgi:cytochrome c biogenesis protein CcdA/thiol-disulfide isomerase/thioredoxin
MINALSIGLGFIEGLALIASPCILPVLPIVLSSSLTDGKLRPYGIIVGFILAFTGFTLLSRALVQALHLDPTVLRQVSFAVLIFVGAVMLSTTLSEAFPQWTVALGQWGDKAQRKLQSSPNVGPYSPRGFWSGLLIGACIGLVWVPCSGPILAAVLVQSIQQKTNLSSVLTVLAFALGAGLPMLLISLQGQAFMEKLTVFKRHSGTLRKVMGLIIILTAIVTSQDLWAFSAPTSPPAVLVKKASPVLMDGLSRPYPAPKLAGIAHWINTKPLTLASLKGKVVLVDFWTYSCINCIRTLPHITGWDAKYRKDGLVVLGVHAPEFEFERNVNNVTKAVQKYGIQYPVAMDNDLKTWVNFSNQYWPAHYLIDRNGDVVYTHFGEGDYETTEKNIQTLLGKTSAIKPAIAPTISRSQTPETYLGYIRASSFSSSPSLVPAKKSVFTPPANLSLHHWSLAGTWKTQPEYVESASADATLTLHFSAKKVFLVLGSKSGQVVPVQLYLNNKPYGKPWVVQQHKLYTLLSLSASQEGQISIKSLKPGLQAYAFTFEG